MRTVQDSSPRSRAFAALAAPAWRAGALVAPPASSGQRQPAATSSIATTITRLRLEAGQRYRISVNSEAFDPVARLYRAGAGRAGRRE